MEKMKKAVLLVATALFLGAGTSFAQVQESTSLKSTQLEEPTQPKKEKRTEIKVENLPAPIQQTLKDTKYQGWEITKAYQIVKSDQTTEYEIVLSDGKTEKKQKFDKEGKSIG